MARKSSKRAARPRGLASLLMRTADEGGARRDGSLPDETESGDGQLLQLRVAQLVPNAHQPRLAFNEAALESLAISIKANGVLQPLVARRREDGTYELIAGERRLRAAKMAGHDTVPVVIRQVSEMQMLGLSLLENIQRDDLNPIEEALGYQKLIDAFALSQDEIAALLGRSRPAITNRLRLLDLPEEIQQMVVAGKISAGHARALLALPSKAMQIKVAERIVRESISVRGVEVIVYDSDPAKKPKQKSRQPQVSPHIRDLQDALSEFFGARVLIEEGKSRGRLIIEFYDNNDFQRILDRIGVSPA